MNDFPHMPESEVMGIFGKMRAECYADVSGVEYSQTIPMAAIDFGSDKILINPKSFAEFENKGMTQEEVVKGYLQHEYFGHKASHPFDVKRIVAEDIALSGLGLDETTRNYTRNRFDDLVGNLKTWNSHEADELRRLYSNFESTSKFDDAEKMFYQDVLGRDFAAKQSNELQPYVSKLKELYLLSGTPVKSVRESMKQVVEFYNAIRPLVDEMKDAAGKNGAGEDLSDIPSKEIEKAVKELMDGGEIGAEDAKKFLKRYAEEKREAEKKKWQGGGAPGGGFSDNPDVYADKVLYNALSEKYSLKIKKLPIERKGGTYPCGYAPWSSSDPPHEIDHFTSFGIIAPGITKKAETKGLNAYGTFEKTPDLLILLDDSGSMQDPTAAVSHAVLSSFVAAKSYIRNGSEVAPVRFSDRTTRPGFSRSEAGVIDELLKFKSGDDTHLDLAEVEKTLRKMGSKKDLDAILISDGEIDNRNEALRYLSDFNRAFMFEIGTSGGPEKKDGVTIYHISKEEDLSNIIVGEVLR